MIIELYDFWKLSSPLLLGKMISIFFCIIITTIITLITIGLLNISDLSILIGLTKQEL